MNSSRRITPDPASPVVVAAPPVALAPTQGSFSRRAVIRTLAGMSQGHLRMTMPDGSLHELGSPAAALARQLPHDLSAAVQLNVRREKFFQRCLLAGDIGFGEAFVDGDWDTPDLTALIAWFILNSEHAPNVSGSRRSGSTMAWLKRLAHRVGQTLLPATRAAASRNIREHYDLSNEFFALWLDPTMMYSSARWPVHAPQLSLEDAQREKNDALCRQLRLKPHDHVLEIGTGWGGWACHAASNYGCRVTSITISREQFEFARQRIAAAGLAERIDVQLRDYRDLSGRYDKIVSIEMLEAIGHRQISEFCAAVDRVLAPDGLLALQFIACAPARYNEYRRNIDFIRKHIFPGGLLVSLNHLNDHLARAGGFVLHAQENFGPDYARTLRLWRDNFHAQLDAVRALGFDDRFIRKWTYYLCYCEAAFAMRHISVTQTLHTRANNLSL